MGGGELFDELAGVHTHDAGALVGDADPVGDLGIVWTGGSGPGIGPAKRPARRAPASR